MKVRNGFVSNSSSASYIVDANKSVFDLACEMLKVRNKDWDGDWDGSVSCKRTELETIQNSDKDVNTPIAFHTTNYDTYIAKFGPIFAISTCNNHDFGSLLNFFNTRVPFGKLKELVKFAYGTNKDILDFEYYDLMEFIEFELSEKMSFWWPTYDVIAKQITDDDSCGRCPRHYLPFVEIVSDGKWSGKAICLRCKEELEMNSD